MNRLDYLSRIISAYVLKRRSQLTFWHEEGQININAFSLPEGKIGEYYMTFSDKADYGGPFDKDGIPLLDYKGKIGLQYNPIAIAQYGLGNFNLYKRNNSQERLSKVLKTADWLRDNLEKNSFGIYVWNHKFDWEYFKVLKAPWYSALAQGQGISLLVRAYTETDRTDYLEAASRAFKSLLTETDKGGVLFIDDDNNWWLEEYIVNPPTHILNGFIWALWGVYDYIGLTQDNEARELWDNCVNTLEKNLKRFDTGFWSLYDLVDTRIRNVASNFYHKLHIVQLEVLYRLTGEKIFKEYKEKWQGYLRRRINRFCALLQKAIFKLRYY